MKDIEELHSNLLTYKILYVLKLNESLRVPTIAELINGSIHLLQDLQEHDLIAYKASNFYTNSNHMILTYKGYKLLENMLLKLFKIDSTDIKILNYINTNINTSTLDILNDLCSVIDEHYGVRYSYLIDTIIKESTSQKVNIFQNGFINYNCSYEDLICNKVDETDIILTISNSGISILNIYNEYSEFVNEMNIKFGVN